MQVIREDGSLDPELDPGLSVDQLVALYKAMVRTRIVDDRLEKIQRQGRIAFHVGSLGEEAAIIGAAAALRDRDWIVPCYREVGALLWRGYPLQRYVDHMYGNAGDPARGRQMPDHSFSRAHRYLAVSAPIGTQIPHAVGVAMAAKKRGLDECVGVFFGDGATSSNDFHAAMNFAGVYQSPVLFLCRNNGYAISLPVAQQTATRTLAEKAAAYRVMASRVDGNDVLAVLAAAREGVQRAVNGGGPTFIELLTYRVGGHSTSDDPGRYVRSRNTPGAKKRKLTPEQAKQMAAYRFKMQMTTTCRNTLHGLLGVVKHTSAESRELWAKEKDRLFEERRKREAAEEE